MLTTHRLRFVQQVLILGAAHVIANWAEVLTILCQCPQYSLPGSGAGFCISDDGHVSVETMSYVSVFFVSDPCFIAHRFEVCMEGGVNPINSTDRSSFTATQRLEVVECPFDSRGRDREGGRRYGLRIVF